MSDKLYKDYYKRICNILNISKIIFENDKSYFENLEDKLKALVFASSFEPVFTASYEQIWKYREIISTGNIDKIINSNLDKQEYERIKDKTNVLFLINKIREKWPKIEKRKKEYIVRELNGMVSDIAKYHLNNT